jgi:chorismate lyase/3-hydroxybenzoate synthase
VRPTLLQTGTPDLPSVIPPLEARPPHWAVAAIRAQGGVAGSLSLLSAVVPDAAGMDAAALDAAVARAYAGIGETLRNQRWHAIRLWNYLPDPGHAMGPGLDRYMVFNAGRHRGYEQWTPVPPLPAASLPTASAVGVEHGDLTIHCLASEAAGRAVENPRQTPAWRYSQRYGPKPPSFSRATIARLGGRDQLLIAGTASIVGEDSTHVDDLAGQLSETFTNLAALIGAATGLDERPADALRRLSELRAYVVRPQDGDAIRAAIRARCSPQMRLDLVEARLCRPELLVEIEGIASVPGDSR